MGAYSIDPSISLTDVEYTGGDGAVGDRVPPSAAPEPSTWVMLMAGFGGLGVIAYRKRGKACGPANPNDNSLNNI
jgi:hypothetical protein